MVDSLCSVDGNCWDKPLFGLMPSSVCYLVQAAHGDLVGLPGMIALYIAHVSEGDEKCTHALAQHTVILTKAFTSVSKSAWLEKYHAFVEYLPFEGCIGKSDTTRITQSRMQQ